MNDLLVENNTVNIECIMSAYDLYNSNSKLQRVMKQLDWIFLPFQNLKLLIYNLITFEELVNRVEQ